MNRLQRVTSYILRKLWLLTAVTVVVIALFITLLRYGLPHMDQYKQDLQALLKDKYNATVTIGSISATWETTGPAIVFNDIRLIEDEGSPIGFDVKQTNMSLNFWDTLLTQNINAEQFTLKGATLSLDLDRIRLESETDYPVVEAMEELFLEQLQKFSVKDSVLKVTKGDKSIQSINIENLSWMNKDVRHQGIGQFRVNELAKNSLSFTLDLYGQKGELFGHFYSQAEQIDMEPWLSNIIPDDRTIVESRINFETWVSFTNDKIENILISLGDNNLIWDYADESHGIQFGKGRVFIKPEPEKWTLHTQGMELVTENGVENFDLVMKKDHQGLSAAIEDTKLSALTPFSSLILNESSLDALNKIDPVATINEFNIRWNKDDLSILSEFSELGWNFYKGLPGVSGISGQAGWSTDRGWLQFDTARQTLDTGPVFNAPLELESFSGGFTLMKENEDWIVQGHQLSLSNSDLIIEPDFKLNLQTSELSILSDIELIELKNAHLYYPKMMGDNTRDYLASAIKDGIVNSATVLWQGKGEDFPFEKGNGKFQAEVQLKNMTFKFDPAWPALTQLDLSLLFQNNDLFMSSSSGFIGKVPVEDIQARIPNLSDADDLFIATKAKASGEALTELMMMSPLKDSVGSALDEVNIKGDVISQLTLDIPLVTGDVLAKGRVTFDKNNLHLDAVDLPVEHVSGVLSFENDKLTASNLKGQLYQLPLTIGVDAKSYQQDYIAVLDLQANWPAKEFIKDKAPHLEGYLDGNIDWSGNLTLKFPKEEKFSYELQLNSDMKELISHLPHPYNKTAGDKMVLSSYTYGDQASSSIHLSMAGSLMFSGTLPHDPMQFSQAHLTIGKDNFVGMGDGFSITAQLDKAEFSDWYEFVTSLIEHGESQQSSVPLFGTPERIRLEVDDLMLLGQPVENAQLDLKPVADAWALKINADQIRADVILYDDWEDKGIAIDADFIRLNEWRESEDGEMSAAEFRQQLPPLSFKCSICQALDYDLGQVEFSMSRSQEGMKLDKVLVVKDGHKLDASGQWFQKNKSNSTRLTGSFVSDDIGALLKEYDLTATVRDSKAEANFDLSWIGGPQGFNFSSLNGDIDWVMSEGYLSEVSDKGARLMSILSLDSLVRKLRLDFRDIFVKGFFYNNMRGELKLKDGVASTSNTKVDGQAADVTLIGSTDLNSRELNYRVAFLPKITSSLPVIIAYMVNPATGLAALALNEVIESAEVVSKVEYAITGTMDEPSIDTLDTQSRKISLPAKRNPEPEMDISVPKVEGLPDKGEG